MTAQINDSFRLRRKSYALAGISEGDLFDPSILELEPVGVCSACWRGYLAQFGLDRSRLILDSLHLTLARRKEAGPIKSSLVINGVSPTGPKSKLDWFDTHYKGLRFHIEYTGGLLLADGFIEDLYVHMGFHPAWKYERVIELIFDRGILTHEYDRSDQVAEFRDQHLQHRGLSAADTMPSSKEIERFIEQAFDRRY